MRYILSVSSRAIAGREADYDQWYDGVHLGEVCTLPGFLSGERFHALDGEGRGTGEVVAHYSVETDNPAALLQSLFAATPTMRLTDAIDTSSVRFTFLQ